MTLTRDQILSANDRKMESVPVPEWGGTVFVRMMTGTERDAYERAQYDLLKIGQIGVNARAHLLLTTICDEAGARLFSESDVEALGSKSATALDRVVRAATALNALTEVEVEEAAKN